MEYIDFLCGYGPVILGYREEEVDDAVVRQIKDKAFASHSHKGIRIRSRKN